VNLFSLFKKSAWSKLKEFDVDVQQDIIYLIAFDTLIKSALYNATNNFVNSVNCSDNEMYKKLANNILNNNLVNELELSILTIGVGKILPIINWNKVLPESVVNYIGLLVMGEFRNNEQLTSDNDITKSGYSFVSIESKSQFLVMLSQSADVSDLQVLKSFDNDFFSDFWCSTKELIFESLPNNVVSEAKGLGAVVKERFNALSKSRQEALIIIADSLINKTTKASAPVLANKALTGHFQYRS